MKHPKSNPRAMTPATKKGAICEAFYLGGRAITITSKMGGQNFPGLGIGFRAFEFNEAFGSCHIYLDTLG